MSGVNILPYVIAVVPAKMTSERFPRKNLAKLSGHPLLWYSVCVAEDVSSIDAIYVSSESDDVLEYADRLDVNTIQRPKSLSHPKVITKDVLCHAFEEVVIRTGKKPDLVVMLQPTHPLRTPESIERAIEAMLDNPEYDSLFSVQPTDELRGTIEGGLYKPEFSLPRNKAEEARYYKNTGSIYVFRPEKSFLTGSFFGDSIYPYILDLPVPDVDVDYPDDMLLVESLLVASKGAFPLFESSESEGEKN